MKCPKCSKEFDDSFKFCPACGEPVSAEEMTPPTPTPTTDQPMPAPPPAIGTAFSPPPPGPMQPSPKGLPPKRPKDNKRILLVVICVVVGLFIIGGIISAVSSQKKATTPTNETDIKETTPSEDITETSPSAPTTTSPPPAPTPAPAPVNSSTMSLAEFQAIQSGMTYEQVVQIVGGPGEIMSESGSPGEAYYTVMYTWEGEGTLGANANCIFQGGALMNKAQFGLE